MIPYVYIRCSAVYLVKSQEAINFQRSFMLNDKLKKIAIFDVDAWNITPLNDATIRFGDY